MNKDWHDVIQQYIAGTLPDDEALTLQNALKSDADLRALYLDYINLDVALGAHAESRAAVIEVLSSPMSGETSRSIRWLTWRPLTAAAAAGILLGMFCTSVVYGLVSRQQISVQTLLLEGFEDVAMTPVRGVPKSVNVWSGDLLAPIEAKGGVTPFEGKRMVALPPVGRKAVRQAYRFVDLTSLHPLKEGQSRQIEVTARFHGEKPGEINRLQMRLAVFAEDVTEARRIWMNNKVNELSLLHVGKPVRTASAEWTEVRSAIDVPVEARVLMVLLGAGEPAAYPSRNEHYLDDVHIRLITREALLP